MTRAALLVLAAASGVLVAAACPSLDPFVCLHDDQCTLRADGMCHEQGACSYPDDVCPSGRRWSETAGAQAGMCVDEEPAASSTASSSDTLGGTASASGTTAADTASSSGPGPLPVCGNGAVEGDEECDEGDADGCDACTADCRLAGQLQWSAVYDGSGQADFFDSPLVHPRGDVIVAGRTTTGTAEADKDRMVARYDAAGRPLWVASDTRPGRDDLNCVVLSPRGELFVAGMQEPDVGLDELWIGSVEDGVLEERLAYDALQPLDTQAHACAFTTDGRLVVVGTIDGGGEGFERWDRLVLYDALSADPQVFVVGGTAAMMGARDIAYKVTPAPAGGFLVAGNVTIDDIQGSQRWLARFDADGAYGPEYIDGGPGRGQEEILGVAVRDGTVYAAGSTVFNDGGTERPWVASFAYEDLTLGWQVELDIPPASLVVDMVLDADGNLLVVIDRRGDLDTLDDNGTAVAALDPASGACLWLVEDPGGLLRAGGLTVGPDGSVVVVGADTAADGPSTNALVASLSP